MPKRADLAATTRQQLMIWPLAGAVGLVIVGALGLALTRQRPAVQPALTQNLEPLRVLDSQESDTPQQSTQAGQALQNAARVNDLIKGKDANQLQQGAVVETLLKEHNLR